MKTNKRVIFGMLIAMVISLGTMNGINSKNSDVSLQQVGLGCAMMGDCSENHSGAWYYTAGLFGGAGLVTAGTTGWTGVGALAGCGLAL